MDDDLFQFGDATPYDDGSIATDVMDNAGNYVATVTRLPDGTAQADVATSSSGFDLSSLFKKATSFLDSVAKGVKTVQTDVTRVQNAVRGATTGAQVGFNAPTTATPYLIAGGIVLGIILLTRD